MTTPLLPRGATVTLVHERINPINGKRPDREIVYAGRAGFTLKGGGPTYWWHERGITWASERLDHLDATKQQFRAAATGGRK
jgi:hypothetical protein